MKSPQIEDGFTRVANELMEQVPRFKLNGTQFRIILVIWRYTYGFKRKDHEFAISFLANAISASKSQVDRELTALIARNVLMVVGVGKDQSRIIQFNKNYSEWIPERRPLKRGQSNEETGDRVNEVEPTAKTSTLDTSKTRTKKERKITLKKGMSDMTIYEQVITHLNQQADKRFSHKSAANKKLINGRMAESRTVEDFIYVIDTKCTHWLDDPKMNEYLRPSTLFSQKNFENYLNQKPAAEQQRDPTITSRDKEVEFQRWMEGGNNPDDFDWS